MSSPTTLLRGRSFARGSAVLAFVALAATILPVSAAQAAAPMCFGEPATIVGTPGDDNGLNTIIGTDGDDVIAALGGDDAVWGLDGNDKICGGGGSELQLDGGDGNDRIDGGAGDRDAISFGFSPRGVEASLATGEATGDGHDTFSDVESIAGSFYDDDLSGDTKSNIILGNDGDDRVFGGGGQDLLAGDPFFGAGDSPGPGDDRIGGGNGIDYATFDGSDAAVTVNLAAGTATGEGTDELESIEGVIGSTHDDTLIGTRRTDYFVGDPLGAGTPGDDTIEGRGAADFMMYLFSQGPVTVDLQPQGDGPEASRDPLLGFATGEGVDALRSTEVIVGTPFDDTLIGNDKVNALFGGAGDDTMVAGGRPDFIDGQEGTDDDANGGRGKDQCANSEVVTRCESTSARSDFADDLETATEGFRKH